MACSPAIDQAKLTKIHTYIHNPLYLLCVSLLHKISCSLSYRFIGFSSSTYIIISSLGEREEEEKRSIVGQPTSYIPHLLLSFSHSHISFPIFSAKKSEFIPPGVVHTFLQYTFIPICVAFGHSPCVVYLWTTCCVSFYSC